MSKIVLKMMADMMGVGPEDLIKSMQDFQNLAIKGVETIDEIDKRLARIERHLKIETPPSLVLIEDKENVG